MANPVYLDETLNRSRVLRGALSNSRLYAGGAIPGYGGYGYPGYGYGGFGYSGYPYGGYGYGVVPQQTYTGVDVDGDGIPDIAVANRTVTPGFRGSYMPYGRYGYGAYAPRTYTGVDVDGDGIPDIAVANPQVRPSVVYGGAFAPQATYAPYGSGLVGYPYGLNGWRGGVQPATTLSPTRVVQAPVVQPQVVTAPVVQAPQPVMTIPQNEVRVGMVPELRRSRVLTNVPKTTVPFHTFASHTVSVPDNTIGDTLRRSREGLLGGPVYAQPPMQTVLAPQMNAFPGFVGGPQQAFPLSGGGYGVIGGPSYVGAPMGYPGYPTTQVIQAPTTTEGEGK